MDAIQYWQQVGQGEEEQAWLAELEAKRIEQANLVLQEIAARDEEFREELEDKFPILKGWK
jgi:hypothetical protein